MVVAVEGRVSRGYYGVLDGDGSTHGLAGPAGSGAIEQLLTEYLAKHEKLLVTPAVFTGGSDYASFMARGIPAGGLHTGTGAEQDPCYHQACDGFENANATVLTRNAKAAAFAMAKLAMAGDRILPRQNTTAIAAGASGGMRIASGVRGERIAWGVEDGARHLGGCGSGHE